MTDLREYFDPEDSPGDALGRAARMVSSRGAMYVGAGVGVERVAGESAQASRYAVTSGGGTTEHFAGPLSAATRGFEIAGRSTAEDSPGGSVAIESPAAAARARELRGIIASRERDAAQYKASIAQAKTQARTSPFMPGGPDVTDQSWEERSLARCQRELRQARTELAQILSRASTPTQEALREATEVGKPGTNWKQVTPAARHKIGPIVKHYMKDPHPFTACVRDNRKRFGDRTEQVCAVVKDLGMRTTKWRRGGRHGKVAEEVERMIVEARGRIAVAVEALGDVGVARLIEGEYEASPQLDALSEGLFADQSLLFLAGEGPSPVGEAFGAGKPAADAYAVARRRGLTVRPASSGPTSSRWDPSKHPRGGRGTSVGGKFVASGASGSEVRAIQRRVGARQDGEFGPKTRAEVEAFQKRHGLAVDGVVGRQTATALRGNYVEARRLSPGALRRTDMRALRRLPKLPARRTPRSVRAGGGRTV